MGKKPTFKIDGRMQTLAILMIGVSIVLGLIMLFTSADRLDALATSLLVGGGALMWGTAVQRESDQRESDETWAKKPDANQDNSDN